MGKGQQKISNWFGDTIMTDVIADLVQAKYVKKWNKNQWTWEIVHWMEDAEPKTEKQNTKIAGNGVAAGAGIINDINRRYSMGVLL